MAEAEMESLADIIDKMNTAEEDGHTVPCRSCRAQVRVTNPAKQFTVRCPACGNEIRMTEKYRLARKFMRPEEKRTACPYCLDIGVVVVTRQIDEMIYMFGYRCVCNAGREHRATGIPIAAGVDMAAVMRKNRG